MKYLQFASLVGFVLTSAFHEEWNRLLDQDRGLKPLNLDAQERLEALKQENVEIQIEVTPKEMFVAVDGNEVLSFENSKVKNDTLLSNMAGVHIIILDGVTSKILASKRFPTNQLTAAGDMTLFLNDIQKDRIILFMAVPEWLLFFDKPAENMLEDFGFKTMGKICNGEIWIGAAVSGTKRVLAEYLTTSMKGQLVPMRAVINVQRSPIASGYRCSWFEIPSMKEQRDFCVSHEGYGDLCSCDGYFVPSVRWKQEKIALREKIPIIIVAASKPLKLYRLLRNLFTIPGASQTEFLIVCDGYNAEIVILAKIFGIKVRMHSPEGERGKNTRTNTNIRFALISGFEVFQSDKIIIVEEDLTVSPDFIRYFQETSWILDNDPSVFCVNAFSYNSLPGVSNNSSRILRVEGYPWYGWMMKRRVALQLASHWVKYETGFDWDWWLLREDLRRHRDVLVPEVSRVFHSGGGGTHVTGSEQLIFFDRIVTNKGSNVKYQDMRSLLLNNYMKTFRQEISKAEIITLDLLGKNKLANAGEGPFVTFVKSGTINDEHLSFKTIQMSLKTYFLDVREHFRGVMVFRIGKKTLYVVGCPMSQEFCLLNRKYPMLVNPTLDLTRLVRNQWEMFSQSLYNMTIRKRTQNSKFVQVVNLENFQSYPH